MKENLIARLIVLLLGIALVVSVVGNIYLLKNRSDTREQVAVISNQLLTADNQIADLQEQLTDFTALQTQVDDLQGQLADQERLLNEQSTITSQSDVQQESDTPSANQEEEPEVKNEPNGRPNRYQPKDGDPYAGLPGYEGEKPGYVYDPGFGYVLIDNSPGGPEYDEPMPVHDCILDENGNCINPEHVHKGMGY